MKEYTWEEGMRMKKIGEEGRRLGKKDDEGRRRMNNEEEEGTLRAMLAKRMDNVDDGRRAKKE